MMQHARGETIQPLLASKQKIVPTDYLWDREYAAPLALWTYHTFWDHLLTTPLTTDVPVIGDSDLRPQKVL
jgi:hypothetical protein